MRPWLKYSIVVLVAFVAIAQFIRPARTNPPVDESRTIRAWTALTPEVRRILERSCNDCHSCNTVWPWYSNVAPVSWLVASDVSEGRRELNLSDWARFNPKQAEKKLKAMCEEVQGGDMPLWFYLPLHPRARLSPGDKQTLCAWTEAERAHISRASAP